MKKYSFLILLIILIFQTKIYAQFAKDIGMPINKPDLFETMPYISIDGKYLIYIAYGKDEIKKVYEARISDDGKWSEPISIDTINNSKLFSQITNPVYNYNAQTLFFQAFTSDTTGTDIYFTDRNSFGWNSPQKLPAPINSKLYEGDPSISPDNKILYFTRKNLNPENSDYECKFIYFSEHKADGTWTEPQLLPNPVNLDCEQSPRVLTDLKTVLMSSVREEGKGEFDIYFTKQVARNVWLTPLKIDTLNSDQIEGFPSISAIDNSVYFSIENTKKKLGSGIYVMEMPEKYRPEPVILLKGKITDLFSGKPVSAEIILSNPITSREIARYKNNPTDGTYVFVLQSGADYKIDYCANNFSHYYTTITTENLTKSRTENQNVQLFPIVNLILNVYDKEIFEPLPASITITDEKNKKIVSTYIDQIATGRYVMKLPVGGKYNLNIGAPFYEPLSLNFDLSEVVLFDEFERDIELTSNKEKFEFKITDDATKQGIEVEFEITDLSTNEKIKIKTKTNKDGKAVVYLRQGSKYEVNISPKGYAFYNTTIELSEDTKQKSVDVALTPLVQEAKLTLNNIVFETNSADLNASSFSELDRVVQLMLTNTNIKIEISAHTDDVGSDKYNQKLSDRRAQSVVNYLIEKEIKVERLVAKGYGETKPLAANDNDANRAKNRRVELRIMDVNQ